MRLPGHDLQPEAPRERYAGRVLPLVHADHVHAQVVQLADDAGADIAQPRHDHVAGHRRVLVAQRSGEPCAHDRRGHQRQESQAVEGQQELRVLLWCRQPRAGDRSARRIKERQVKRIRQASSPHTMR
jgi:hypothetical protein